MAFDTLSYARRLKQAGVPDEQAEAMADATRELVISDFASKGDTAGLKEDIAALRTELKADIAALRAELKADIAALRAELKEDIAALRTELKGEIAALEQRVTAAMDTLGLRLTVRLEGLIAIGVAVLAAIIKL
jgi:uncharacterized protein involved in exopolysaccharide biosynthesis